VGDAIEHAVRRDGGILDARDLAAYRPRITVEEAAWYRDVRYSTAGDSLGYEALNILSYFEPTRYGPDSAEFRRLMAEAIGSRVRRHHALLSRPGPGSRSGGAPQ
jgi:gamma-glutamyltranspeptidase